MSDNITMKQDALEECCRWWQKRLRLMDWEIHVLVVRDNDDTMGSNLGCCNVTEQFKLSTIRLQDPIDYLNDRFPYDMEHTLVHEMLHILLWGCKIPLLPAPEAICEEQAINFLADALVDEARKARGFVTWEIQ